MKQPVGCYTKTVGITSKKDIALKTLGEKTQQDGVSSMKREDGYLIHS
mgnify:CR=1 FL=1